MALFIALLLVDHSLLYRARYYIDLSSVETLVALLAVSKGLELSGTLQRIAEYLLERLGSRPRILIATLLLLSAITASIAMNDTVLFIYIPLAVSICRTLGIEVAPIIVLLTAAINLGSALTPIGNPQNIVLWRASQVPFKSFTRFMSVFTTLSLSILLAYTALVTRRVRFREWRKPPRVALRKDMLIASATLLPLSIALIDLGYPWAAPIVALASLAIVYPRILIYIDWVVVAMLALMFIDFRELAHLLPLSRIALHLGKCATIAFAALLSQAISNVPTTVALLNYVDWRALAIGVNIGGIGVAHSSLANLIAIRLSRISLSRFHRCSIPLFLAILTLFEILAVLGLYP